MLPLWGHYTCYTCILGCNTLAIPSAVLLRMEQKLEGSSFALESSRLPTHTVQPLLHPGGPTLWLWHGLVAAPGPPVWGPSASG